MLKTDSGDPRVCVVCGGPATRVPPAAFAPSGRRPCCADPHCQMVLRRAADMGEASFASFLSLQAGATRRRRAEVRRLQHRHQTEAQANARLLDVLQQRILETSTNAPAASMGLALPSGPAAAAPLPRERKRNYLRYLMELVRAAMAQRASDEVQAPQGVAVPEEYGAFSGQMCAVCRGGCCPGGKDHAYLQAETIHRYLGRHPDHGPGQIVRAYLRRLPEAGVIGGCINQTPTGCSLPRSLRARPCNQFVCMAMAAVQLRERQEPPLGQVMVVQRRLNHWQQLQGSGSNPVVGVALIAATGFERLPDALWQPVWAQAADLQAGDVDAADAAHEADTADDAGQKSQGLA